MKLKLQSFTGSAALDHRLYNDENSKYVVTKVTLKNTSVEETFTKHFGYSVGKILHKKNDAAIRHGQ